MGLKWAIHGREFGNCNCAYGCPCQFNALPTHGNCEAVVAIQIDKGHHGDTHLDGLRLAGIFAWPGAIHEGKGEAQAIVDKRANAAQRDALLRILSGQDTEPGATIFAVFATTFAKFHAPIFADIDFNVDIDKRKAQLRVDGVIDGRGEPIKNPITGAEFRGQIKLDGGFEYTIAEMGRGWTKTKGQIALDLADTYGMFAELHLGETGIIRA